MRSLVGYSPQGRKESDMTERLHFHFHFMSKWDLSQGWKDSWIYVNWSLWYAILTNWRGKVIWSFQHTQKKLWQNSAPIYDKNTPKSENRGNILQHNKGHIWQTYSQHYTQPWKAKNFSSKIRNKTRMLTLATFIQHSVGSPNHNNQTIKRKKRSWNWKGKNKTVIVCRWHGIIYRCHQKHLTDATKSS